MGYEEFVESFKSKILEILSDENVELVRQRCVKVNEELDAITIRYPDSVIAPTIYLEDKYEAYQRGQSVEFIAEKTIGQLRIAQREAPELPELTEESARKNLYCAVINADSNAELLKDVPHERVEDLAIIPRFRISDNASFIVHNSLCSSIRMTSEEIMEVARSNTYKQHFECQNMVEAMREIMKSQGVPENDIEEFLQEQARECPLYVMSNSQKVDGAVALISDDAMEKAYQKIKADHPEMEDMYVLGSSRHELILIPDSAVDSIEALKMIHHEVQNTELSNADKLTNNIYRYNAMARKLNLADKPVLVKTESKSMHISKSHARKH